jgi:hypothetical protein
MRRVNHDTLGFWPFAGEPGEDAVEDAEPAPANEAVVERLVRTLASRRVLPLETVADHVDDAAHHPAVIDPRYSVGQRKERRYPRHLALAQQKQITHQGLLLEAVNHISNEINRS